VVKLATGPAEGPYRFSVETEGGCDLLQWTLQIAMEQVPTLFVAIVNGVNAYGEI
jgi:hypothetical protein